MGTVLQQNKLLTVAVLSGVFTCRGPADNLPVLCWFWQQRGERFLHGTNTPLLVAIGRICRFWGVLWWPLQRTMTVHSTAQHAMHNKHSTAQQPVRY